VHSTAVRREALTSQLPRHDAPNPDKRPTWTRADCTTGQALADDAPTGPTPDTTSRATP
jgi:hypothetical protein